MLDGTSISLGIAFLAGLVSFLATCLIPILPSYLAFLVGTQDPTDVRKKKRALLFRSALAFVIGFLVVFVLLGMTANSLGRAVGGFRREIQFFGGLFLVLAGLVMTGFLRILPLERSFQIGARWLQAKGGVAGAFVFGLFFALSWTPCIGPVLAVILFWASQTGTALGGGVLLFAYGLGLGVPFLLASLFLRWIFSVLQRHLRFLWVLHRGAGVVVMISGVLFFTGRLGWLASLIIGIFG